MSWRGAGELPRQERKTSLSAPWTGSCWVWGLGDRELLGLGLGVQGATRSGTWGQRRDTEFLLIGYAPGASTCFIKPPAIVWIWIDTCVCLQGWNSWYIMEEKCFPSFLEVCENPNFHWAPLLGDGSTPSRPAAFYSTALELSILWMYKCSAVPWTAHCLLTSFPLPSALLCRHV